MNGGAVPAAPTGGYAVFAFSTRFYGADKSDVNWGDWYLVGIGNTPRLIGKQILDDLIIYFFDQGWTGEYRVELPDYSQRRTDAPPFLAWVPFAIAKSPIETTSPSSPPTTALPPPATHSEVHAVVISNQGHPERIFRADAQIHLTGGIVALGKPLMNEPLSPISWPTGLKITPDADYLTGRKVPPLTPNIVDVRIRNFRAGAEIERQAPSASKNN